MINNKDIDKYLCDISALIPVSNNSKKRFLKDMRASIDAYVEDTSSHSIDGLYKEFGSPTNVAFDFIDSMDTDTLLKQLSFTRIIRRVLTVILIIAFLSLAIYTSVLYRGYIEFKNNIVTNTETEIIEGESP